MKEFKQMAQILWKRNKLWIIMLVALTVLFQNLQSQTNIQNYKKSNFVWVAANIEWLYEFKDVEENPKENEKTGDFKGETPIMTRDTSRIENKIEKEIEGGISQNLIKNYNDKFIELSKIYSYSPENSEDFWKIHNTERDDLKFEIFNILEDYYRIIGNKVTETEDGIYLNISQNVFYIDVPLIILAIILGFLLTSLEHLTPYYDFTRMFPWSKTKTYFNKILFGSGIILVVWIFISLLKYGIWKSSIFKDLVVLENILTSGVILVFLLLGTFFIVMALGTVSGNILGHAGMLLISYTGLNLWIHNGGVLTKLILGEVPQNFWLSRFQSWITQLPDFIQLLLSPISINLNESTPLDTASVTAYGFLGLLYLLLGWFWENHNETQRSGMLIMRKPLSIFAQFLAVLTTTNIIYTFFDNGLSLGFSATFFSVILYVIAFLLSYLFYKGLFKIRIGI